LILDLYCTKTRQVKKANQYEHLAGKTAKEAGYTAEVAVHKRAAVVVPIDSAVRKAAAHKAVVHMTAEVVVDSRGLAAPDQSREMEHVETEAVDLEAVGEVCYSPTVLEDTVKMCHREPGLAVVGRVIVVAHRNQDAVA
jgi:hypothetical protein